MNEKEEEEVAYDWSERNTNIARKKDYHAVRIMDVIQNKVPSAAFLVSVWFLKLIIFEFEGADERT